jgi:hypothetical protein
MRTELARSGACEALCKALTYTVAATAAAAAAAAGDNSTTAAATAADSAAWTGAVAVCALAERCPTAAVRLRSAGGVGIIGRGLARALRVAAADAATAGREVDDVGSVMLEALGSGDEVLIVIEVCSCNTALYREALRCTDVQHSDRAQDVKQSLQPQSQILQCCCGVAPAASVSISALLCYHLLLRLIIASAATHLHAHTLMNINRA